MSGVGDISSTTSLSPLTRNREEASIELEQIQVIHELREDSSIGNINIDTTTTEASHKQQQQQQQQQTEQSKDKQKGSNSDNNNSNNNNNNNNNSNGSNKKQVKNKAKEDEDEDEDEETTKSQEENRNEHKNKKGLKNKIRFIRHYIYQTLENPEYSKIARGVNMYLTFLIFFSTITLCLQSIYSLTNTPSKEFVWNVIETIIVTSFTIDYGLRLLTCPSLKGFIFNFLNLIDLLAIIPFYIGLVLEGANLEGLGAVRVLRLIRIFRIFKIGKTSQALQLLLISLRKASEGIAVLAFMVMMAIIFFSSFMFFAEQSICTLDEERGLWIYTSGPRKGEATPFQSIVATFWWAIVTMTTVGYGDHVPLSIPGKIVGAFTIVCGIMVLAFPINVVGVSFSETYQEFEAKKKKKMLEKRIKKAQRRAQKGVTGGVSVSSQSNASEASLGTDKGDSKQQRTEKRMEFESRLTEIVQKMETLNQEVSDLCKLYYAD